MIILDTSETTDNSKLPKVFGATTSGVLEKTTGADIMVSPLDIPVNTAHLVQRHVQEGALLVQRKSLLDFPNSVGPRLNSSLEKMRATGAHQHQCLLLVTGTFLPSGTDGTVRVGVPKIHGDGRITFGCESSPVRYTALWTAIRHWIFRGGVFIDLPCDEAIPFWLHETEKDLASLEPVKEFLPRQELSGIENGRRVLVAFPGIGLKRASALWDSLGHKSLVQALYLASVEHPVHGQEVFGWGPKVRHAVREELGLEPGFDLAVSINIDELEGMKKLAWPVSNEALSLLLAAKLKELEERQDYLRRRGDNLEERRWLNEATLILASAVNIFEKRKEGQK